MECCYHLRNMHDKMADDKAAYEYIFGVQFDGLLILFGVKVSYKPCLRKMDRFGWQTDPRGNYRRISCCFRVETDLSISRPHRGERPAEGNLEQDGKIKERTPFPK